MSIQNPLPQNILADFNCQRMENGNHHFGRHYYTQCLRHIVFFDHLPFEYNQQFYCQLQDLHGVIVIICIEIIVLSESTVIVFLSGSGGILHRNRNLRIVKLRRNLRKVMDFVHNASIFIIIFLKLCLFPAIFFPNLPHIF